MIFCSLSCLQKYFFITMVKHNNEESAGDKLNLASNIWGEKVAENVETELSKVRRSFDLPTQFFTFIVIVFLVYSCAHKFPPTLYEHE